MSVPPDPHHGESAPRLDAVELVSALESSRRLGMLGPAPISDVIEHSAAFLAPLDGVSGTVVDLGSGGGVPGLVIAWMRSDLRVVLVDRRATRTDHLQRLVLRLAIADRVRVVTTDADALMIDAPADAVVARGFGPPGRVLAAALRILSPAGRIVVSAPPERVEGKWPPALLARHAVQLSERSSPGVVVIHRR